MKSVPPPVHKIPFFFKGVLPLVCFFLPFTAGLCVVIVCPVIELVVDSVAGVVDPVAEVAMLIRLHLFNEMVVFTY